jgi:hypothetical protein
MVSRWHAARPPPLGADAGPNEDFEPQARLSTNLEHIPEQILPWCILRWTMEVTLAEARAHRGMETQHQWNDQASARTTPALLRLYLIITLTSHQLLQKGIGMVRTTAWYAQARPTFADAIALVQ